jgi:two-component system sensor histidine kinase/response regulator
VSQPDQPITLEDRKEQCKPIVLVIDDNPRYAKLFELLADRLNITAHLVSSCYEGIEAMKQFSFDIVLMDWFMPEVDGLACTRKIRELEKDTGRRIPIIGVSGYTKATKEQCMAAGMDDFIIVPFTLEALHATLCYWLQTTTEDPVPQKYEHKPEADETAK